MAIWAEPLELWIPGLPVAQPRARAGITAGKVVVYGADSKHKIHDWKAMLRLQASKAMESRHPLPSGVAIGLTATFFFARSKQMEKDDPGRINYRHVRSPDADNLIKAVKDAFNLIVWADDCQVADECIYKRWGDNPGCQIYVQELPINGGPR